MSINNTVSRQGIEQTILEQIRLRLVAMGYLPDINTYLPKTPVTETAYKAAISALIGTGVELIEPFGVSSQERRGEKRQHKITINLRGINNGRIGTRGTVLEPQPPLLVDYQRTDYNTQSKNLTYEIRTITDSAQYDRICMQAVMQALTSSGVGQSYNPILSDGSGYDLQHIFWLRFVSSTDVKTPVFFERIYTYEVLDVWTDDWGVNPYQVAIPIITKIEGSGIKQGEEILIFEFQ